MRRTKTQRFAEWLLEMPSEMFPLPKDKMLVVKGYFHPVHRHSPFQPPLCPHFSRLISYHVHSIANEFFNFWNALSCPFWRDSTSRSENLGFFAIAKTFLPAKRWSAVPCQTAKFGRSRVALEVLSSGVLVRKLISVRGCGCASSLSHTAAAVHINKNLTTYGRLLYI